MSILAIKIILKIEFCQTYVWQMASSYALRAQDHLCYS